MTPRGLLTTIGATALGFALVIGGTPVLSEVLAQEAMPPAAATPAETGPAQEIEFEAQRARAYDAFVAALASELGSDAAAVDAAIRAALVQRVDEREAAGELGTEAAAAKRAVIEVSQAPLFLGFGSRGEMHGFDGHDGGHGHRGRAGFEGRGPRGGIDDAIGARPGEAPPQTLPGDDSAANQAAPASLIPAGDVAL